MINFLNYILNSNYFDKINPFFARKIFKIFKIFFVETKLNALPKNNYKIIEKNILSDFEKGKLYENNKNKPYMSYSHLLDLVSVMIGKDTFNFYDYGASNLNLYFYLRKNVKNLNYFFYDLKKIRDLLKIYKDNQELGNLQISDNKSFDNYDLVYFGSSLQYLHNYKEEILKFKNNTSYLLISQTPFFENIHSNNENIILKQVNMHPNINYLYSINFTYFIEFMKKNNFRLIDKNLNRVTKFLNFKNFKNNYKNMDMFDLLFKKTK
jgi:hypothetical protein